MVETQLKHPLFDVFDEKLIFSAALAAFSSEFQRFPSRQRTLDQFEEVNHVTKGCSRSLIATAILHEGRPTRSSLFFFFFF